MLTNTLALVSQLRDKDREIEVLKEHIRQANVLIKTLACQLAEALDLPTSVRQFQESVSEIVANADRP